MTLYQQFNALISILSHEWIRMRRISIQVFLAPLTSTLLYFLIFGTIIGKRVGPIDGMDYSQYIAPGLVMFAVIMNSYSNVATSLYSSRFQKNIEEFLVSPAPNYILLFGYCLGGTLRGLGIGILVLIIVCFFTHFDLSYILIILSLIFIVSLCFSLAGFTNAILADSFEDVALIPTFILSPLTYLSGVFYSVEMLSPFWQKLAYLNPILYMVDALRQIMNGKITNLVLATLLMIGGLILILSGVNLILLKRGIGIQE